MNSFSSPYDVVFRDQLTQERITRKLDSLDARHWIIPATSHISGWAFEQGLSKTDCGHLTSSSNGVLSEYVKQRIF
jgi:hypothetical protein